MKKILKIDRRNRLALIEPGVTYAELQPALQENGLRVVAPLLPRKNKSVIASLLEREPVMSPKYQWNLLEPLRSLEIVWGNGDKFYSGSGTLREKKMRIGMQVVCRFSTRTGTIGFLQVCLGCRGKHGHCHLGVGKV